MGAWLLDTWRVDCGQDPRTFAAIIEHLRDLARQHGVASCQVPIEAYEALCRARRRSLGKGDWMTGWRRRKDSVLRLRGIMAAMLDGLRQGLPPAALQQEARLLGFYGVAWSQKYSEPQGLCLILAVLCRYCQVLRRRFRDKLQARPAPGQVTILHGASCAGKTYLLQSMQGDFRKLTANRGYRLSPLPYLWRIVSAEYLVECLAQHGADKGALVQGGALLLPTAPEYADMEKHYGIRFHHVLVAAKDMETYRQRIAQRKRQHMAARLAQDHRRRLRFKSIYDQVIAH